MMRKLCNLNITRAFNILKMNNIKTEAYHCMVFYFTEYCITLQIHEQQKSQHLLTDLQTVEEL